MLRFKRGIALLITLLFIVAITVSIGLGLKYINNASKEVEKENFLYQSKIIVEDILSILKNSQELANIAKENSTDELYAFLSQTQTIPLNTDDLDINIQITSARSKFNVNNLMDTNKTINVKSTEILREYFAKYMINNSYVDILLDNMGGILKDNSYNSDIFNQKPYLFRDYIASRKHLLEINDFYMKSYHENSLKNIDFDKLFYFSDKRDIAIDLNYASLEVWEMLLGIDKERAKQLILSAGAYTKIENLALTKEEKDSLSNFKVSYFEPYIYVVVEIIQNDEKAKVSFEYNIINKEGSNFTYEI